MATVFDDIIDDKNVVEKPVTTASSTPQEDNGRLIDGAKFDPKGIQGTVRGVDIAKDVKSNNKPTTPQSQSMSYEDMYKRLNPFRPPTTEELEKEKKKEKRDKLFASLGDGLRALSNLYFTTQYAPNMYSHANSQSVKENDRYNRLNAERNANMRAYIDGLQRAKSLDIAQDNNEREWQRRLGIDAYNRQKQDDAKKYKEDRDKIRDEQFSKGLELKKGIAEAREAHQKEVLNERRRSAKAREAQGSQRIALSKQRAAGSSSSGSKYRLYNPETGQYEYFANQGSRDQRAGELGYNVSGGESVSTTTDKMTGKSKVNTRKQGVNASSNLGIQEAQRKKQRQQKLNNQSSKKPPLN